MILPSLSATFLAGLAGSPHCIGMCGGFAASCAGRDAGFPWHIGRLSSYALLGAAAGAAGAAVPGPAWIPTAISVVAVVAFSLVLGGVLPEPKFSAPRISRLATRLISEKGWMGRWAFGATTALLPCGLVYAALAIPIATGSALTGAASMVVFGIATVPALTVVTLGSRRLALRDLRTRRVLAVLVLISGLTSVALRTAGSGSAHLNHASPVSSPASTEDAMSPHVSAPTHHTPGGTSSFDG